MEPFLMRPFCTENRVATLNLYLALSFFMCDILTVTLMLIVILITVPPKVIYMKQFVLQPLHASGNVGHLQTARHSYNYKATQTTWRLHTEKATDVLLATAIMQYK
jgi:hypothetical protein